MIPRPPPDPLSRRAERMREHLARLALERADDPKRTTCDCPACREGGPFLTRKERRILNRLEGIPPRAGDKFPGCAPNSKVPSSDDPLEQLSRRVISEKMKADFARRRAEKVAARGEQPADDPPSGNKPSKGRAGILWD